LRFNKLILIALVLVLGFAFVGDVEAATLRDTQAELTPPVGGDLLPGGGVFNNETDIRETVIFSRVIPFAIKWTVNFAIGLAVIAIIIGGYQFVTAFGNTEKHDKARKTITFALIGLILALTAFGIVRIISNISFT